MKFIHTIVEDNELHGILISGKLVLLMALKHISLKYMDVMHNLINTEKRAV
jgi:hypothetical protein